MRMQFLLMLLVCGWSSSGRADWPQMRGPAGQGHSDAKRLPTQWSATEGLTWTQELPGKGWSTPIVVGKFIYLTTAIPKSDDAKADQSLEVVKLDASTGKIVEQKALFLQEGKTAPPIHAKNSHASPTPIYADGKIYVHFGHMGTACVKADNLEIVWTNRELKYKPVHGNGGSPLLHAGKLYISIDGLDRRSLVALDAQTGKIAWETKRSKPANRPFSFGTPVFVEIDKTPMVVATSSDGLYGYDPKSGQELWVQDYSGYSVVPVPLFANGLIYISTGYDRPSLLAVKVAKAEGKFTTKVEWTVKADVPHNPSMVIVGNELYMVSDNGIASCLDAKTGKPHWRERIPGAYSSSVLHGGGHLFFLNEQGACTVIKPGTSYNLVRTNSLTGRTLASLAVDGEQLLLRTDKKLFKISGSKEAANPAGR